MKTLTFNMMSVVPMVMYLMWMVGIAWLVKHYQVYNRGIILDMCLGLMMMVGAIICNTSLIWGITIAMLVGYTFGVCMVVYKMKKMYK